jgi:DNA invertase Pin-like site-specific DNA recombinase
MVKYIAYYRVSTKAQGQSGLGLEAQQALVAPYADDILHSFTEVESGKNDDRPQLAAALELCRELGASILIAKIDRLSRDAAFLLTLRKAGVDIVAADMPNAGTLEFGVRAVVAEHEREQISQRTTAALAAAKQRGVKLGSPNPRAGGLAAGAARRAKTQAVAKKALPVITALHDAGASLRAIATQLNEMGIPTATGRTWWPKTVSNMMELQNV